MPIKRLIGRRGISRDGTVYGGTDVSRIHAEILFSNY